MAIKFSWDPKKAKRNFRAHGIAFEVASKVFSDPNVIIVEDTDVDDELRYHAIGFVSAKLLTVVVYVDLSEEDDEQEELRIISARKAEAFEEEIYADQFK